MSKSCTVHAGINLAGGTKDIVIAFKNCDFIPDRIICREIAYGTVSALAVENKAYAIYYKEINKYVGSFIPNSIIHPNILYQNAYKQIPTQMTLSVNLADGTAQTETVGYLSAYLELLKD